jgi:hypothetical protein
MGLQCARKAASFAAFSSFDLGHYGGFPQVSGSFISLGVRLVREDGLEYTFALERDEAGLNRSGIPESPGF